MLKKAKKEVRFEEMCVAERQKEKITNEKRVDRRLRRGEKIERWKELKKILRSTKKTKKMVIKFNVVADDSEDSEDDEDEGNKVIKNWAVFEDVGSGGDWAKFGSGGENSEDDEDEGGKSMKKWAVFDDDGPCGIENCTTCY